MEISGRSRWVSVVSTETPFQIPSVYSSLFNVYGLRSDILKKTLIINNMLNIRWGFRGKCSSPPLKVIKKKDRKTVTFAK